LALKALWETPVKEIRELWKAAVDRAAA